MLPSGFVNSQSTPCGGSPATFIMSIVASVCPGRSNTPPSLATSGNTCPGRLKSSGRAVCAIAAFIVVTRSAAETPVVTPSAASMDTVNAVPYELVFFCTICGSLRESALSFVMQRHTMPLHLRISKAICSEVSVSAGKIRSPSFSLSSSSTIMTPFPCLNDETALKMRSSGGPQCDNRFRLMQNSLWFARIRAHDEVRRNTAGERSAPSPLSAAFSSIRTVTVGSGITPDLQTLSLERRSRTFQNWITAGGDLHPALRIAPQYYSNKFSNASGSI